jgi:hypothetical protein
MSVVALVIAPSIALNLDSLPTDVSEGTKIEKTISVDENNQAVANTATTTLENAEEVNAETETTKEVVKNADADTQTTEGETVNNEEEITVETAIEN